MKKRMLAILLALALLCALLPQVAVPVSAASYLESCTKYKTSITVKVTSKTSLMSLPCSSGSNSSSTVVYTPSVGEELTVVAMYENPYGNYWYQIAGKSATCYAYSGNTSFVSYNKSGDLSTSDMTVTWVKGRPSVLELGKSFTNDGKVKSAYSTMTQVATYVYSGSGVTSGTPVIKAVCSGLSATSFDIEANKTNTSLKFENISDEGMYTYCIKAKVKYFYCDDGKTLNEKTSSEQTVFNFTFREVKKSSTPSVTQTVAKERLNYLINKLADGKHYFTKAGTSPCTTPAESNHGCAGCQMNKVITKPWINQLLDYKTPVYTIQGSITHYTPTGTDTNGQSCSGFANFAGWYIFAEDAGNKVTFEKHFQGARTYATMQHAKPGDLIRSTSLGHSMVFVSCNSSNFTVLDCNYGSSTYGQCIIRKHTISYSSSDTVAISRAKNYDIPTYTVKYNANGGTGAPSSQTKWKGEPLTLSKTIPTREGYSFKGWASSASATAVEYKAGADYETDAAITLYAVWTQNACVHEYTYAVEDAPTVTDPGTLLGTCTKCGENATVTLPALDQTEYTYILVTAAGCEEPGLERYTWKDTSYGTFSFDVVLDAIGHDWTEPEYDWVEDYSTCTASCSCSNEENNVLTGTVASTSEITLPATCTEAGETTYTASFASPFETQTVTVPDIAAIGHDWNEPTYVWSEDNSTVTATRTCKNDESHVETETVATTSEITEPATETEEGELTYTAVFTNPAFATQTKKEAIPKLDPTPTDPVDTHPADEYPDVNESDWFYGAADYIIGTGYMGSTSQTEKTFEPYTKVSRSMVASILYRIAGSPAGVEYKGTFTDVPEGQWFTTAIEWCAQNGLANGKGDGRFDPNGNVTRQELAVFMYKLADYLEKDTNTAADLTAFPDGSTVPDWAAPYLEWAVASGLITGKGQTDGATLLAPADTAMRCELASILQRFLSK